MILHFGQRRFTDDVTFMIVTPQEFVVGDSSPSNAAKAATTNLSTFSGNIVGLHTAIAYSAIIFNFRPTSERKVSGGVARSGRPATAG
jgi:hypothetical protein